MRKVVVTDMYHLGEKYGAWAHQIEHVGFPAIQPFMKEAEKTSLSRVEPFDDETGMFVHDCLLVMKKVSPHLFEIFMYKYVSALSINQIQKKLDISNTTYKRDIYAALQSLKMMVCENKCIFLA